MTPEQPQGQLLVDLNPQPGDVLECVEGSEHFTEGKTYTVAVNGQMPDDDGPDQWRYGRWPERPRFRIVSRAAPKQGYCFNPVGQPAPEPWTIFNNTSAHGLLTDAQRAELQAWDGKFERYNGTWLKTQPGWAREVIYRAIPKPALVPDIIPWAAMLPEWKWAARDVDGELWISTDPMMQVENEWSGLGLYCRIDHLLPGVTIGTMPWQDSLQQRPEI